MNVLVIEDSRTDQELVRQLIGDHHALAFTAALADGLEILKGGNVDAAIVDLHLLDADGTSIIDKVRQVAPRIPLVVMTGAGEGPELDTLRKGADEFLLKGQVAAQTIERALCRASERQAAGYTSRCPLYAECVKAAEINPGGCPLYDPLMRRIDAAGAIVDKLESLSTKGT